MRCVECGQWCYVGGAVWGVKCSQGCYEGVECSQGCYEECRV